MYTNTSTAVAGEQMKELDSSITTALKFPLTAILEATNMKPQNTQEDT